MKKRMKLLSLILVGGITLGSSGTVSVQGAKQESPLAGISAVLAELPETLGQAVAESLSQAEEAPETLSAPQEMPEEKSEFADIAIAQVNNYVNVRKEPNTESEILGKLYDNSAATVLEMTEDGWYLVQSGSVEGYVKAEYVIVGDEELAKEVGTRYATVTTTTLFVRSEPTTESRVLTMLPEGDDLVVEDESTEGWAKVSTVEGEGYVSTEYVELMTEYIYAESKQEEEERLAREEAERQAAIRAAEEARRAREAEEAAKRAREAEEAAKRAKEAEAATKRAQSAAASTASGANNTNTTSNAGSSSQTSGNTSSGSSSQTSGNTSSGSSSQTSGNTSSGSSSQTSGNSSSGSSSSQQSGSISNGQAVVNYAKQFLGNPYVYGGTSLTNGADCSGFVQSVYAAFGVSLPRNSTAQRSAGYAVSLADIQPGDIVCYSGHVGIYAGNNTLIHASNERTGITLTSPVTYRQVLAVRRIF